MMSFTDLRFTAIKRLGGQQITHKIDPIFLIMCLAILIFGKISFDFLFKLLSQKFDIAWFLREPVVN